MMAILGLKTIIILIGLGVFIYVYKYSRNIFDWVERNTFGTQNYILEKLEMLYIKVEPSHVTYVLLFLSFGIGILTILVAGLFGAWTLGIILGIIFSFIGWKIPKPIVDYMVTKRIKEYSGQMVDALTLLANGIRAGLSVPQAIG